MTEQFNEREERISLINVLMVMAATLTVSSAIALPLIDNIMLTIALSTSGLMSAIAGLIIRSAYPKRSTYSVIQLPGAPVFIDSNNRVLIAKECVPPFPVDLTESGFISLYGNPVHIEHLTRDITSDLTKVI